MTTTPTTFDLKTFCLSHSVWIAAAVVGFIGFHAWIGEHDARLAADAAIKNSQATIATLKQQIAQTDARAAQKVQVVTRIVHDVSTPAQAITAIPQLTNAPLNARVSPDNPVQVSVDAVAFIGLLGQAKTDAINLAACQSDLGAQQKISSAKDTEIAALKKKPAFWKRVEGTAKAVGIVVGIGILLAVRL